MVTVFNYRNSNLINRTADGSVRTVSNEAESSTNSDDRMLPDLEKVDGPGYSTRFIRNRYLQPHLYHQDVLKTLDIVLSFKNACGHMIR
ncbi:unnamed protein product [Absidia cylindrospora]